MASDSNAMPATGTSAAHASSSLAPEVRDIQRIFLHNWLELLNDQAVMQQLPAGLRLEMQNAFSETSRFFITERITQDYISGPEPLQSALRGFEARHRYTIVEVPQTSSEIRLFDNDMPPIDPRFVGRERSLQQIPDALLTQEPKSVIIRGAHGIGKSTLARKAVADPKIGDAYNIAWIPCESIATVEDLERCLANAPQLVGHLRRAMMQGVLPHAHITRSRGAAAHTSEEQPKRLLIVLNRIDRLVVTYQRRDAPLLSLIKRLEQKRVASLCPRLLITLSTHHDLGINSVDIDVGPLSDYDAAKFFVAFSCTQRWRDSPGLQSFVRRFGGHPLALSIAARAAPKDGDLETYTALLQSQQHVDNDELDAAIRILLFDSSLQHPKTRQLLRLVAYWPTSCLVEVICATLNFPDIPTAITFADPASRLNLLRFHKGLGGCYTMMEPLKDRLRRIDPPLDEELASIRAFLFVRVFREAAWSHWASDTSFIPFFNLDSIFVDAFRSDDHGVIALALDAVFLIPRYYGFGFQCPSALYNVGYVHQLDSRTLEEACAAADRIGDAARYRSLRLALVENKAWSFGYLEGASLEDIKADLRRVMEDATLASDRRGFRKYCYLLGWCELVNARTAFDEQRVSCLLQARRFLSMVDRRAESRCFSCPCSEYFPATSRENTLDTVQLYLLSFHFCLVTQAMEQAYDIYLRLLAAFDEGRITPSERAEVELHIRLHTAAAFALHGALEYAGKVVNLSARTFPLGQPRDNLPFALILFRCYLAHHKDAPCWRMQLAESILFLRSGTLGVGGLYGHAEAALLFLEVDGGRRGLRSAWLAMLCWWSLSQDADEQAEIEVSPTFEDMLVLKDSLPPPHDRHAPSYHHGYAALLALCDGKLGEAARRFAIVESICLNDLPYPAIDPKDVHGHPTLDNFRFFPPHIMKSVWPPIFGALARDCLLQQAVAQSCVTAAD